MEFLGPDLIREIDGLSAFEPPAWVPDGALVHLDFVGNRYWSAARGVVAAADLLEGDVDWWAGYDVPDQLLDIVPGVGLTTGPTTTQFSEHGGPFLNPNTYAEVVGGGGFALVAEVEGSSTGALAGNNAWGFYCVLATKPAWQPNADCYVAMRNNSGTIGPRAYFGDNWTTYGSPIYPPGGPTNPIRLAIDFDIATDKWIGAVNGDAMNALDGVTNMAGAEAIGIGCVASGLSNSVTTTIPFVTFYPRMTQARLNSVSLHPGDVSGPASAANGEIALFSGVSGKAIKSSVASISTDTALAANSDANVPTQKAVKAYVDNAVIGLFDFKGSTDCSANPNYPAALKGDSYVVSVAGKIGGASGKSVDAGDLYLATADNAGGTEAGVGASWTVLEHNLSGVMLAANNLSDLTDPAAARAVLNVANGATANSPDATLFARANHTGTQAAATISDFAATARAETEAALIAGANVTITPAGSGATRTFTVAASGGGGGSPGGASGELQYNDGAGGFAGAANAEIEGGNLKLVSTTDPAAPAGGVLFYSKSIAGRHLPKIIGPSGIDTVMQVGLHGNSVFMFGPASGTTAPIAWGGTLTTAATMSMQLTVASANPWLATQRKRFASAGTAGSSTGCRTAYVQWFRGNAAGFGGFFFRAQFGQNLNVNGAQMFVGLCASTGALATTAGAVSALLNMIGVGYDTTDANTGNWQLFRNDGSGTATKVDLGATNAARNTTHGFDLIIHCPPGAATEIFVRIVNIHTGAVVLDTSYTTDLPAVNTGMAFKAECNNGAVASAQNIELAKVYIESDY